MNNEILYLPLRNSPSCTKSFNHTWYEVPISRGSNRIAPISRIHLGFFLKAQSDRPGQTGLPLDSLKQSKTSTISNGFVEIEAGIQSTPVRPARSDWITTTR